MLLKGQLRARAEQNGRKLQVRDIEVISPKARQV